MFPGTFPTMPIHMLSNNHTVSAVLNYTKLLHLVAFAAASTITFHTSDFQWRSIQVQRCCIHQSLQHFFGLPFGFRLQQLIDGIWWGHTWTSQNLRCYYCRGGLCHRSCSSRSYSQGAGYCCWCLSDAIRPVSAVCTKNMTVSTIARSQQDQEQAPTLNLNLSSHRLWILQQQAEFDRRFLGMLPAIRALHSPRDVTMLLYNPACIMAIAFTAFPPSVTLATANAGCCALTTGVGGKVVGCCLAALWL